MRNEIVKHFETRHYKVVEMDIDAVESTPQAEKTYMGTEGYIVRLNSITLEATQGNPHFKDIKEKVTFKDGIIRIKKGRSPIQKWIITDITNIPVE